MLLPRAGRADSWTGRDKAYHFAASAVIAGGAYGVFAPAVERRGHALLLGGTVALGVGVAKEWFDHSTGRGDPSWKDFSWDVVGVVAGLGLAWGLDLAIRGVEPDGPALVVAPSHRGVDLVLVF